VAKTETKTKIKLLSKIKMQFHRITKQLNVDISIYMDNADMQISAHTLMEIMNWEMQQLHFQNQSTKW